MKPTVKLFTPEGGFSCNCYAVELSGEIALVDIGEASGELVAFCRENVDKIKYILQTHCHYDHIMGLEKISALLPKAKIVIHKNDAEGFSNGSLSLCMQMGLRIPQISELFEVEDGDKLPLGSGEITVMHTPGHTAGSVIYIIEDVIFSGDTLFRTSCGRTDLPTGNGRQMLASLKRIKALLGDYRIFAGHDAETTLSFERENNRYMNL